MKQPANLKTITLFQFFSAKTLLCATLLLFATVGNTFAQKGKQLAKIQGDFLPNAIYEVRYWTNMANRLDTRVYLDTMIFFGNERASFQYPSQDNLSQKYRSTDSLIYNLLPQISGSNKEFIMGKNILRRMHQVQVPFRGQERPVYKLYVGGLETKDNGMGEYALVSQKFGIIYRYNNKGDIYMLNQIDVLRDGYRVDEIDLMPLHLQLMQSDIFTGSTE